VNSKDRRDRILDVAIDLAEQGGFENVRQRDVADQAGIALGTLYKSFSSKEDILSAALEREAQLLEKKMEQKPVLGATESERLQVLFKIITRAMCKKPKYARALLRAMASGEPEVAGNVATYEQRMNRIIIAALRGDEKPSEVDETTRREATIGSYLQKIWFASLVGWSAGLHDQNVVVEQLELACELLLDATGEWKK
jgi:AcrR family transcriptional regulator